jgi:hypothetical protein
MVSNDMNQSNDKTRMNTRTACTTAAAAAARAGALPRNDSPFSRPVPSLPADFFSLSKEIAA